MKYEIFELYFCVYYIVWKRFWKNLVYFDGFVGCGYYCDLDSSVVELGLLMCVLWFFVNDNDFVKKVLCIFVEVNGKNYVEFEIVVDEFYLLNGYI